MDIDEEESRAFKEFSAGWDEAFIEEERNRLKEIVERHKTKVHECQHQHQDANLAAFYLARDALDCYNKKHPLTNNTSSKGDKPPATVATPADETLDTDGLVAWQASTLESWGEIKSALVIESFA